MPTEETSAVKLASEDEDPLKEIFDGCLISEVFSRFKNYCFHMFVFTIVELTCTVKIKICILLYLFVV